MSKTNSNNLVTMGKVVGAFGILGFIKIKTDTNNTADSLSNYKTLYLKTHEEWTLYRVNKSFAHDNILNAKLEGINDRDAAIMLKGAFIGVPRTEFPKLKDPDEFYWVDLVGLRVINQENITLGIVSDLMESGANSVLVVNGDIQHLIPFVNAYIIKVDLVQKQIMVNWGIDY
jgi:16S rRNA processing protein RimM